jgi:hypothetical protein
VSGAAVLLPYRCEPWQPTQVGASPLIAAFGAWIDAAQSRPAASWQVSQGTTLASALCG